MNSKSTEELCVTATGTQSFHDRFCERRYDYETPVLAAWRCNLTGLSQLHNLYFIAYGQNIYVYVPQFPTQAISENPVLIFTSQPSNPNLTGYLDPRHPHYINNLVIQFLGTEEVVAVVRDDGDVDAFLVRHIVQAIERRAEPDSTIGVVGDDIRPFFQSNVGITAWGLAIHAQARILATSSNLHEVRVFKFGLLQTDDDDEDADLMDVDRDEASTASQRKTDVTHEILNGEANIPYISFCNTGDDPEGRWLLTTDISGISRVMDLHGLKSAQWFCFGDNESRLSRYDRENAGWSIMFLDRRSFRMEESCVSALGTKENVAFAASEGAKSTPFHTLDVSSSILRVSDVWEPFLYHEEVDGERRISGRNAESPDVAMPQTIDEDLADSESDGGVEIEIEVARLQSENEDGIEEDEDESEPNDTVETALSVDLNPNSTPYEHVDSSDEELHFRLTKWYYDPGFVSAFKSSGGPPLAHHLRCPILHTSPRNVYLIQTGDLAFRSKPFSPPTIGMANPLHQPLHEDFMYLKVFDRLNMTASIPALGIVIVASQKGRALVLALTKVHDPHGRPEFEGRTVYTMRPHAILPFAEQEKRNERPPAPLHGLAVSPVQQGGSGREGRWRVMMMYQSHAVLSYEIRWRGEERVEVEKLVV